LVPCPGLGSSAPPTSKYRNELCLDGIQFGRAMLITYDQRRMARTLQGWAVSVLLEAGVVRECEEHGWMPDRTDPMRESVPSTGSAAALERLRPSRCSTIMNAPSPDQALIHCAQCGAWPMALAPNEIKDSRRLSFRCPKCHAVSVFSIGAAGSLVPAVPAKAQTPLVADETRPR